MALFEEMNVVFGKCLISKSVHVSRLLDMVAYNYLPPIYQERFFTCLNPFCADTMDCEGRLHSVGWEVICVAGCYGAAFCCVDEAEEQLKSEGTEMFCGAR